MVPMLLSSIILAQYAIFPGGILNVGRSFVFGITQVRGSRKETRLRIETGGKMIISDTFEMLAGSWISVISGGTLIVNGGFINENVQIICGDNITIGKGCAIGRDVIIRNFDGHYIDSPDYRISEPIVIGDHVWIGQGAQILKGVTIGSGAIIAAGSIVTHSVKENTLVGGVPARIIRENISWH